MTPESAIRLLEDFLSASRDAVVLENGAPIFDLATSKYSISGEHGKCLLHLWSAERNVVGRVLEAEVRNNVLRLAVQRLGQAHPATSNWKLAIENWKFPLTLSTLPTIFAR